jgi:Domain of unknown function (DUF4218)
MCGPMYLHYMYPFERGMNNLKELCQSRWPEGSIVEGYNAEEVIEFYSEHTDGLHPMRHPKSQHEGRL